jgi:hypothetical protein
MSRFKFGWVLVLCAALMLGCGDDDDDGGSTTCQPTETKACTCTSGATGTRACIKGAWGGCRCLPVKKDGGTAADSSSSGAG